MEKVRRAIKLFFAIYGNFLFKIIGIIVLILLTLRGINYLYKENVVDVKKEKEIEKSIEKEENKLIEEERELISKFIDYCNNHLIEEAYKMLSENCKKEQFKTKDEFEINYINELFGYKKEYKIEKIENKFKVIIYDGILESGRIEDRANKTTYYKIEDTVIEKRIYIER